MKKDVKTGIIILILAILLLGITYVVNAANLFSFLNFLNEPLIGKGLGPLCSSLSDCQDFCHTSKGLCDEYCQANPTNKICDLLT